MTRKRLTQILPWLTPLRQWQRKSCFYAGMRLDGHRYSREKRESIPFQTLLYQAKSRLYNAETGFPMVFQENKVWNLKLAAKALDGLVIGPGETYSFWRSVRHADREEPYRDGLALVDGKLTTSHGGGLCQMSNMLFLLFLHSPLTIVERHPHQVKEFPDPEEDGLKGVDATVAEGWLDVKVKNEGYNTFRLSVSVGEEYLEGRLLYDGEDDAYYRISNDNLTYHREEGRIYEEVDVIRHMERRGRRDKVASQKLYHNRCEIRYPLQPNVKIVEKREKPNGGKRDG